MEIRISNIEELEKGAEKFLEETGDCRHIAFHAEMGGGKTTFISALCKVLGIEDEVTSPTFSIVNEYKGGPKCDRTVYHFDFYRIESEAETIDLGLDDYFESDSLCLMEWPENVEAFLPEDTLHVRIEVDPAGERIIKF